jgi:hypothetical protein
MDPLPVGLTALLPCAVFGNLMALAYALVLRLLRGAGARTRICAALVVFFALQGLLFLVLSVLGVFTVGVVALAAVVLPLVAACALLRPEPVRRLMREDLEALRASIGELWTGRWRWLWVVIGLYLAFRTARGLVAPPLSWDGLTYHLPRAIFWIKGAGRTSYDAPGAWSYYRHYLPYGDALTAWSILGVRSTILVPLTWLGVWASALLGAYSLGRQLGASRHRALLAAMAAGLMPAVSAHIFTTYVDNLVLALVLLGAALLHRMEREGEVAPGVLGMLALATALGVKHTGAIFVVAGAVLLLGALPRGRRARGIGLAALACAAAALPPYLRNLWSTGSPTYPFQLSIGSTVIFRGDPEQAALYALARPFLERGRLSVLLVGGFYDSWHHHANFGPAAPLVAIGALVALAHIRRRSGPWTTVVLMLASWISVVAMVTTLNSAGFNIARYVAAAPAIWLAFLAADERRLAGGALWLALAAHLAILQPVTWARVDHVATACCLAACLPLLAAGAAIVCLARRRRWRPRRLGAAAAVAVVLAYVAVTVVVPPIRGRFRYDIYHEAARGRTQSNHPVAGRYARSFPSVPLWRHVDGPRPTRVAVTAGWDGMGHNLFLHPFFGSRLQNEIVFVPVTAGGEPVAAREGALRARRADYRAWRRRLVERRVDYVAVLAPPPLESTWIEGHPKDFRLVAEGAPGNRLYRVVRDDAD